MERAAAVTVRRSGSTVSPSIEKIESLLPVNYEVQPGQTDYLVFIAGWDTPGYSLDYVLRKLHMNGISATEVAANDDDG